MFDLIAFDADDTLWHNEDLYQDAQERFERLIAGYCDVRQLGKKLEQIEAGNIGIFGYGIKGFALSLIETAIEVTEGRIQASDIQGIIEIARQMLQSGTRLLENVEEVIRELSRSYPLMIITKGDLLDQENKLQRSGLMPLVKYVEIVPDKTTERYAAILNRLRIAPERFLMVGNSLRSDIEPVVTLGGRAVHIPYRLVWAHEEKTSAPLESTRFYRLENIGQLPGLIERLSREG